MQIGQCIKTLRSENGGEYTSGAMAKFCKDRGIEKEIYTPVHPPAQWSDRTDKSYAGGMCSLYAGARRIAWIILVRSIKEFTFLRNRCPTAS